MSRTFLRFICRGLRGVYAGFAAATSLAGDSRIYYTEICHLLETSPVRIDVYEKFLAGVDSAVRHAYHGAGFGDTERPGPEKELLVNARIPPVLVNAVSTIFQTVVPALKSEVDRMVIYLGDYTWLGFGHDRRSELFRRNREVDILKKMPLRTITSSPAGGSSGGGGNRNTTTNNNTNNSTSNTNKPNASTEQRLRRCVRCCEVSGDTHPPRSLLSFQMIARLGLLRSCVCGGMWALESRSTAASNGAGQMGSTAATAANNSSSSSPAMQQELARTPGLMQGS